MTFFNDTPYINYKSSDFVDITKSGKERPWNEKKLANVGYYELLHLLRFKKAERVRDCANVLEFKPTDEGRLTLYKTWFCKSKLCPLCNWRRTMKQSSQITSVIAEVVRRKPKARWLFLTLTVKNVYDGKSLKESLSGMTKAFNRLVKYKKVAKNLIGFMRATEVTVNPKDNSYNQHLHVLLCVENTYFKNTENYITQTHWTSLWQKAMKLDYIPTVHVQAVKPKSDRPSDMQSVVAETAKYPVKDTDFMTKDTDKNAQRVADLEEGLFRKRLISYGGLLKQIHKELNLDDVEDGDLVHAEDEEDEALEDAYTITAIWNWKRSKYYLQD